MEEEHWRKLPEELQLKLADDHLPLLTQCQLRSVSRAWKTPRLRPKSLQGLYVRRENRLESGLSLGLYDRKIEKFHTVLRAGSLQLMLADCVNGLLGGVLGRKKMNTKKVKQDMKQVHEVIVFNVFCLSCTRLPPLPPAPNRTCIFACMSRKPRAAGDPAPRIGITNPGDYIFVVAMGNLLWAKVRKVLQVYNAGQWSSILLRLPPGHLLMDSEDPDRFGVLRGSEFFFLTMHSNNTEASLCCVDLLSENKRCRVICGLDKAFVSSWCDRSEEHPKLAICSGKLLLVHRLVLPGSEGVTLGVEVLDEERLRWRFVSSLPLDLKADPTSTRCHPTEVTCGGDELVVCSEGLGQIYNFVTGAWSTTPENLYPISYL